MFSATNRLVSLRSQITLIFLSLILLTVIGLVISFFIAVSNYSEIQNDRRINNAKGVLNQYLAEEEKLLVTAARVLTADFGFKQAVASRDEATISDVLSNTHGKRINADLMSLIDMQGQVINSSIAELNINTAQLQELTTDLQVDSGSNFIRIGDAIYQVILLPVQAPRTIAYAMIGFAFDKETLTELRDLTGLEISVFAIQNVVVTSLPTKSEAYQHLLQSEQTESNLFSRPDFKFQSLPFGKNADLRVLLSAPLSQENEEFYRLLILFVIVAAVLAVITIFVSALLSKSVTNPLYQLVKYTKDIGSGIFEQHAETDVQSFEVQQLYSAFGKMNEAIEQRENEIVFRAEHDLLTSLPNRLAVIKKLDSWCSDKQLIIMSLSIMNFRELNDSMGPAIGDATLKNFAERLSNYIEYTDTATFVGRVSDNNFVFIQETIPAVEPEIYTTALTSFLSAPYQIEQFTIELTISVGVVLTPQFGIDSDTIMRRLMIVATEAKAQQGKLAFYQSGQDDEYLRRIALLNDLRTNLQSPNPDLFMVYQPKLDFHSGRHNKVEALIRWINADGQFINPEEFIALAENSGLIIPLTRWVIRTVIEQLNSWDDLGFELSASINVSAMDVLHEGFTENLIAETERNKISNQRVSIELTERDLAENEEILLTRLNNLKSLGFKISVDDYGIGQSSLSKLKNLPVDELKIDKSFILKLDESRVDQNIVRSTISLGHELGMSVVAEGVENLASLELLREFKCDLIQGYHICKPQKQDQLIEWLKDVETTN